MVLAQLHLQGTHTDSRMVMKMIADTGIQQSCPPLSSPAAGVMSTGNGKFSHVYFSALNVDWVLSTCSQYSGTVWSKLESILASQHNCAHTRDIMLTFVNACSSSGNAAACNILL